MTEDDHLLQWHPPVPEEHFHLSQGYLNEDWKLYPAFGHHAGVDYGSAGQTSVSIFAVAHGEIVYRAVADSQWGKWLGNHLALYVPEVKRSFLYCHMATEPHELGHVKAGAHIGIMGKTGQTAQAAIHLHLEGWHGKFVIGERAFTSLDDIKKKTFDADAFIRAHLHNH